MLPRVQIMLMERMNLSHASLFSWLVVIVKCTTIAFIPSIIFCSSVQSFQAFILHRSILFTTLSPYEKTRFSQSKQQFISSPTTTTATATTTAAETTTLSSSPLLNMSTDSLSHLDPLPQPTLPTKTRQTYTNKNILLTGASSGLGYALALQLSTCNVQHLILSGRNIDALQRVAEECQNIASSRKYSQTKVHVLPCDLADLQAVQQMAIQTLQACSGNNDQRGIDILINNGGISSRSKFTDTSIDVDELLIKVNYLSGAALAKQLVPSMIQHQYGKIIWISSVQGKVGIPNRTSYAASKFAVQGYCDALRAELASSGISVHVISPGYIRTNLSRSAVMGNGQTYNQVDETTANGAYPSDVAVKILNSVASGQTDLVVAATLSAKVAIWLRLLFPSLLEWLLVKRFEKSERTNTAQKIDVPSSGKGKMD